MSTNPYIYTGHGFFIAEDDKPFFKQVLRIMEHHKDSETILAHLGSTNDAYQLPVMVEFLQEESSFHKDWPKLSLMALSNSNEEYDRILVVMDHTVKKIYDKYDSPDDGSFYIDLPAASDIIDSGIVNFLKVFGIDKEVRPLIWTNFN